MKIINAFPGMGDNDWRRDEKFYVNNFNLLIRIGLKDEEGEPNVIPPQSQYPHSQEIYHEDGHRRLTN